MLGLNQTEADPSTLNQPGVIRQGFNQPRLNQPRSNQLGLNQPGTNQRGFSQPLSNPRSMNEPVRPEMDSFRPTSLNGLDSFFEREQPRKSNGLRILLLVVLLAALAAAGWWTYGYLDHAESRKTAPSTGVGKSLDSAASPTQNETPNQLSNNSPSISPSASSSAPSGVSPNNSPSTLPSPQNTPPATAESSQVSPPSTAVPETPSHNANASPDTSITVTAPKTKPSTEAPSAAMANKRSAEKPNPHGTSARASKPFEPAAADTGTADFQKGEAYLYGRGAPENCDQAVKYLKSAAAKSSAKARSAFGTMYATGHCVARDLPTSYLWFAMALRIDPNNQILEKDLSAIWNQMTPPERQLATRMKQ
jgi:hypothetical protein